MTWTTYFLAELHDVFHHLSHESLKTLLREFKLVEFCENKILLPHTRSIGNGVFQLRIAFPAYTLLFTSSTKKISYFAGLRWLNRQNRNESGSRS